jgi:PAS domain S-box-containing protein
VATDTDDALLAQLVADVADYAILLLDPTGHVTTWNAGAERIKGYTAEQILGRHFSVFYPPEDVAAGRPGAELVTALEQGRLEHEGWRLRRDGSRFWANVVITTLRDADGVVQGFGKVTRDLTRRRAAELALELAERRWRTLLDHLPDTSVLVVDADLRYRVVMGAGLQRQGLAHAQGRTVFETSSRQNASVLAVLYRQALDGLPGSTELVSPNARLTTEIDVLPLPPQDGVHEAIVMARDVSAARARERGVAKAEEGLRRLFDEAPNGVACWTPTAVWCRPTTPCAPWSVGTCATCSVRTCESSTASTREHAEEGC